MLDLFVYFLFCSLWDWWFFKISFFFFLIKGMVYVTLALFTHIFWSCFSRATKISGILKKEQLILSILFVCKELEACVLFNILIWKLYLPLSEMLSKCAWKMLKWHCEKLSWAFPMIFWHALWLFSLSNIASVNGFQFLPVGPTPRAVKMLQFQLSI